MGRKFVIAGNYAQYVRWCEENGLEYKPREAIWVQDVTRLRGLVLEEGDEFVYVGNYYERKDFKEIEEYVRVLEATRAS